MSLTRLRGNIGGPSIGGHLIVPALAFQWVVFPKLPIYGFLIIWHTQLKTSAQYGNSSSEWYQQSVSQKAF
jgi:hypothetical protein